MNEKVTLYEILDAKEFIEKIEGEETDVEEYSAALAIQEENKVNAAVGYLRDVELKAEMVDTEINRLKELKTFYKNRAERVKKSVAWAMQSHDITKIETNMCRLSFRKSESVETTDELPDEYVKETVTVKADKVKIKRALKDGIKIEGAKLIETNNLQIK